LEEAVKSIMYAAPKTEVKELQTLRTLFGEKFGKEFTGSAMEGLKGGVSDKVVRKLEVRPPREELVQGYLEEIARAYGVDWSGGKAVANQVPEEVEELNLLDMDDDGVVGGGGGGGGGGSALKDLESLNASEPDAPKVDVAETNYPKETTAAERKGTPSTAAPVAKTMKTGSPAGSSSGASARKTPDVPAPKASPKETEMKAMNKAEGPKKEEPPSSGIPDLSELERRFAALKRLG
jgi:vacuolar protein sorting-associated protein IST1